MIGKHFFDPYAFFTLYFEIYISVLNPIPNIVYTFELWELSLCKNVFVAKKIKNEFEYNADYWLTPKELFLNTLRIIFFILDDQTVLWGDWANLYFWLTVVLSVCWKTEFNKMETLDTLSLASVLKFADYFFKKKLSN